MRLFRRSTRVPAEQRAITFQSIWGSGGNLSKINGSTQEQALRLVPVFAAARLLSDGVSSLPLVEFERGPTNRVPVELSPVFARGAVGDPFRPAGEGTTQSWIAKAVTSMVLRGNAFGLPTSFGPDGRVTRVEWLHPDDVEIVDDCAATPQWLVGGEPVDGLIHVPNFVVPGRTLGLSPIAAYRATIETGLHAQDFGRDWFRNGATPSGVVSVDAQVNEDQAKSVKSMFKRASKNREPVVMGKGWDYKPISVNADESQFLATIKATATQVAAIYGIPPEKIGGESGNSMTYANVEQAGLALTQDAYRPYMTKLEAALSDLLPPARFVLFNADATNRMSTKERYEAHASGLDKKWLTIDEVRAAENRPPIETSRTKSYQDVGLPALVAAGIVSPKWAAEQVGAPTDGLSDKAERIVEEKP